jgi:hypothetical protein
MIPGTIFIVSLYVPTDNSQIKVAQAFSIRESLGELVMSEMSVI